MKRADLVTTSSEGMLANLPGHGRAKGRVLNNGADSVTFMKAIGSKAPQDLAAVPQPRIGYVGSLNAKMDLEMLLAVTERRPEWHWVFLGPTYFNGQDPASVLARNRWNQLVERGNVHYFGRKPKEEMPAYVNNMDILTICYKIANIDQGDAESWVVHGYPTKLHEFLATGLPVVAGRQQVIVDHFSHVVQLADGADSWEQAIDDGLKNGGVGTAATRQKVALENTWDSRVDKLSGWLDEMVGDINS